MYMLISAEKQNLAGYPLTFINVISVSDFLRHCELHNALGAVVDINDAQCNTCEC